VNCGNSHHCTNTLLGGRYFSTSTRANDKHEVRQPVKVKFSSFITEKGERCLIFAPIDLYRVIHVIGHPLTLQLAYELIKSKKGNMPATNQTLDDINEDWFNKTLDGINQDWFNKTSAKIIAGTYQ